MRKERSRSVKRPRFNWIFLAFCLPELADILFLDKGDHTLRKNGIFKGVGQ